MATTTTNFGWDIPQSTDLVKDGATAIAALGQDIDTALVDLKGGTTGQVLAKASNTDLDFSWVAQDDANAIQNTQLTAKGALISAFSSATPATLTVGTNGQVLTADSTQATGLAWATPAGGGMTVIASGSLSTGTVTISSIPDTYKDLQLVLRDWYPSADAQLTARLNNASVSNSYSHTGSYFTGSTTTNFGGLYSLSVLTWQQADAANYRNACVVDIPDYTNTTANKFMNIVSGYADATGSNYFVDRATTMWNESTPAAVNRIDLILTAGTFSGGTYILYGVK